MTLPDSLRGPGKTIRTEGYDRFVESRSTQFPHLDPDFISQLCYELPDHIDACLPNFDPAIHQAVRISRSCEWILENVRYYDGTDISKEWGWQVDRHLNGGTGASPALEPMVSTGTWSFPPVIIGAPFARELGLKTPGGTYFLIEGTHRYSYLARLLELGRIAPESMHQLIEVAPRNGT